MTAEVLVLNKSALALAADSAVTIGEGDSGKVYNSVNKLFRLSKYHPIGVMIYANADYMGVPLETIIKMYQEHLGNRREDTVDQYAQKFMTYLRGSQFSSAYQQRENVSRTFRIAFEVLAKDMRSCLRRESLEKGRLTRERHDQIITQVSMEHLERLEAAKRFRGFTRARESEVLSRYRREYKIVRPFLPPKAPTPSVEKTWQKIAALSITRQQTQYPTYSGIVIAGFGESEIFPRYISILDAGVASDTHRFTISDRDGIDHKGNAAVVVPFAQHEMVKRFMDGVDPRYEQFLHGAIDGAMKELAEGIIDVHVRGTKNNKETIRKAVVKQIPDILREIRSTAEKWRRDMFVSPVMTAVQNLPKEELASLAEALVNLTSIKRRVSTERETVGGPIDVAVISKGDGFVWIKRKNYFDAAINPQFLSHYMHSK